MKKLANQNKSSFTVSFVAVTIIIIIIIIAAQSVYSKKNREITP